jgi:hypothetical protein
MLLASNLKSIVNYISSKFSKLFKNKQNNYFVKKEEKGFNPNSSNLLLRLVLGKEYNNIPNF